MQFSCTIPLFFYRALKLPIVFLLSPSRLLQILSEHIEYQQSSAEVVEPTPTFMNTNIRILLADDSSAVRRLVLKTLSQHAGLEVVGLAADGKQALQMLPGARPDVVILDVEMPVMDGMDTLKAIQRIDRQLPVIMFSSLTVSGGEATLEALAQGARDYVAKPSGTSNVQQAVDYINAQLLPRIRQWGSMTAAEASGTVARLRPASATIAVPVSRLRTSGHPVDVVAIGSSTGGPNALAEIVAKLPASLETPVLIVQHMPTLFTRLLAERLDRSSALKVREATDGVAVRPGEVWIAPGDQHMTAVRRGTEVRLALNQGPLENSCRPAVDVLFRSVATVYGSRSLAVMLTGMGKDGLEGCRVLKHRGAHVLAQDESSCVVWGMPRAVTEANLADQIVPLKKMHAEITRIARPNLPKAVPAGNI